ncbi:protein CNPPD1 [Diorhabda sublineata]|uniref:protein CNPPD1 n=1 Tax=Diorhabda sublineata TaxID=1163346 RepID=UPI0024E1015F|nr:protein CNPPD1 [Diorhabda sublineata]
MSKIFKDCGDKPYMFGDRNKYLSRITKSLYYGKLPATDCLSLPVTELAAEIFSEAQQGKSLDRLHYYKAADISRNACVAPCSLVLALLYLERLKTCNSQYLDRVAPSDLFLVSLMVSCKFLFDDGEGDEVFLDEWAISGNIPIKDLIKLEKEFLNAIKWNIFVSKSKFYEKLKEIESTLALKQGKQRNFFTYTELETLSSLVEIQKIIHCLITVSAVLALTYLAGVLTLVGSVYLTSQIPGTTLYHKIEGKVKEPLTQSRNDIWEPCLDLKTDIDNKLRAPRVIGMLKTSILLASIKTNDTYVNKNFENISWDYWNNPVMDWLARTSELVSYFTVNPIFNVPNYLETTTTNMKRIQLEDQIHKATKTRIQDQIESSWHTEWIETIKIGIYTESINF